MAAKPSGVCASGDYDPELWQPISERDPEIGVAQMLCSTCPIQVACLTSALDNGERHGIWGGTTPGDRTHIPARVLLRRVENAQAQVMAHRTNLVAS